MIALLSGGLLIRRSGNLVFVCGGNGEEHLRPKFCSFLQNKAPEYNVFMPEFAMSDYFSDELGAQLDLGRFEELVGELSHAIVIFPEAPGSFAETGYFAQTESLAKKSLLVLDLNHQGSDSFIMMGPARRYEEQSRFQPNIQIDFDNPDFLVILKRMQRFSLPKNRKAIDFKKLSSYDIFCLIFKIFDLLIVATYEDLVAVFNSLTGGHAPTRRIKDIGSILVGAGFLRPVGEFGHYDCQPLGSGLVQLREGMVEDELSLKLEVQEILRSDSDEFASLVAERANVD